MVQFGSGSERIQPKRPLGVPDGWRGKAQPRSGGGGSTPTPHPTAVLQPGAGTAVRAASMSQRCSGHWWYLPWWGLWGLHGLSEGYPIWGSWQIPLLRGEGSLGGSRGASLHKGPLPTPVCLRHPQTSSTGPGQWACGQAPLMTEGDRTAPWPPRPAAPAKRQQLGTSARATCSPACSPGCGVTLGCPLLLAVGRAPGSGRRLLASQCCQTLWQKSRCPVRLQGSLGASLGTMSSHHTAAAPGAGGTGAGGPCRRGQWPDLWRGSLSCQHPCASYRQALGHCVPPHPLLLLSGTAVPAPDVPVQGLPCPRSAPWRGQAACGQAGVGSSPQQQLRLISLEGLAAWDPPRQCSAPCAM